METDPAESALSLSNLPVDVCLFGKYLWVAARVRVCVCVCVAHIPIPCVWAQQGFCCLHQHWAGPHDDDDDDDDDDEDAL